MDTSSLAIALEKINGAWTVLDLILVTYLSYYLFHELKLQHFRWRIFHLALHVQAAIAILVFHVGDLGVRAIVWFLRHQANAGANLSYLAADSVSLPIVLFSFVAGFGILCQLRVFSSPWLGPWIWLIGAAFGFTAAELTHYLPLFPI